MLALMTYLIPISALIAVHGLVQFGANSSRTFIQRQNVEWRITGVFLIGAIIGAIAGASIALQLPKQTLLIILGIFIFVLVWFKFPKIKNANALIIGAGGLVTTFVSMFVGATGPLVAVFLNQLFSDHKRMVATHGASMVAQHGIKVLAFAVAGFSFTQWLPLIVMIIASGYLGTLAGTAIMNRLPEKALKLLFKTTLTLVSLDMLHRGVLG
jgi:uncharacterized membrane protein YfcA